MDFGKPAIGDFSPLDSIISLPKRTKMRRAFCYRNRVAGFRVEAETFTTVSPKKIEWIQTQILRVISRKRIGRTCVHWGFHSHGIGLYMLLFEHRYCLRYCPICLATIATYRHRATAAWYSSEMSASSASLASPVSESGRFS